MARTLLRPALTLATAWVVSCANGRLSDAPPLTDEGVAGETATPGGAASSGGAATAAGGAANAGAPGGSGAPNGTIGGNAAQDPLGAGSGAPNVPSDPMPNGYYIAGSWHGRAWVKTTGTGSRIMPASFADVALGSPYCGAGSVVALPDYSGTATIGVNLNQGVEPDAPAETLVPGEDGVLVSVSNRGGSALRVELRGPNADNDESQRWCAPISGSGGFIAWSSFNTACWDDSGSAYGREPIVSASILVPGDDEDVVSYDVCLNSIAEANSGATNPGSNDPGSNPGAAGAGNAGGAATGAGGAPSAGGAGGSGGKAIMSSGTLSERYDWQPVLHDGKNYIVQNNVWGAGASQTITFNETSFKVTAQSGTNGTSGAPVSYPSSFIGSNYERTTSGSNLPKLVSALTNVQTSWSNNAGGAIAGTYNASYDVWFSTNADGDPEAPSGGYLMVWFYDPADAQPIGSVVAPGVTVPGVSGSWDIWLGNNGNVPCISYVRTQPIQSLTFDLNAFIQHAVGRGTIKSEWYLSNVFAGFEIWSGGVGLESSGFYAIVN